jgi:hypothetical protein
VSQRYCGQEGEINLLNLIQSRTDMMDEFHVALFVFENSLLERIAKEYHFFFCFVAPFLFGTNWTLSTCTAVPSAGTAVQDILCLSTLN